MDEVLLSSKSEHWCTPRTILDPISIVDTIGLDPCSNIYSTVNAKKALMLPEHDGLACSWQNEGLVFVNPPYGRKILAWAKKMQAEGEAGGEILALLPARVDTAWFHDHITRSATFVFFWKGRLSFTDGLTGLKSDPAPFPSMLAYWGPRPDKFLAVFDSRGAVALFG